VADGRCAVPRIATRGTASWIDLRAVGVLVVICVALAACTVDDDTEAREEAVIAAATQVRDAVDMQMGAGRTAAVELDSSNAFCDCPVATVRGTVKGAAVDVNAATQEAAREAGFEHFEPLAVPDGLDPATSHGFKASAKGLDLSFRADDVDVLAESEVILTVRDTDGGTG
jgi:hypothetical protein